MTVQTLAPAKINWTLEVLGKRPDGYHEVRTVLQTIDLCDKIMLTRARTLSLAVSGLHSAADDDHTLQAARLLSPSAAHGLSASIRIDKRTPVAAGLGGGSSDAAATLRGLNRLWEIGLMHGELSRLAEQIGSDVAFFLSGGTALAEGRGEVIAPLPDVPEMWLVILAPPLRMEDKTRRMYGALRPEDFSDGVCTAALAQRLRKGEAVREESLCNAFERAAYETFEGLTGYRDRLLGAGAKGVHLAGAGPAIFSVHDSRAEAEAVVGRLDARQARVFVARTLGAAEAARMELVSE
jgi:4-diphosphocytidyl-2-C-methyl-D-erythritol kinase